MKCPKCQFENPENAKFCGKCGAKLLKVCPQCGTENSPANIFCNECGHDLQKPVEQPSIDYAQPQSYTPKFLAEKILTTRSSIEGERKLVTVLFADVANYTSIAEKLDPEEVHQIMDGCFRVLVDEIHRHEGTIDKFTGDGVMALFGAPVARENHAQRACHAALAIQRAIQEYGEKIQRDRGLEFKIRVGLNSGPVIIGTIGDDLRMDYTAIGDTTNLASRMETMARPGIILVSGNTHKLIRDYFECASLGLVEVKGKEKPQEAYELVKTSEVETRFEAAMARGLTRFVGRGKEIKALREALRKARDGSGQVVGIVGEAGVGKSRLILELRKAISEDEYASLQGLCHHYGDSMPYLPILDILKSYLNIQEKDGEYIIKRKVRERLSRLDEKLLGSLPSLHELLSVRVEDKKYLQLDAQQRRQRTFEDIRELLLGISQNKTLLLILEDLHWIDKTSQEFLDYLIGWLANTPVLLVLLYRPEYTHSWSNKSYYTQISLDQLSTQSSADLVQAILKEGEVVPELRELILGRAGGNPLFVEEFTHSLVENGSIQRENDHYVLAGEPSEIQVPDSIQGIIAARMDRMDDKLKKIIQVASVIGREFAYRILATITGMKEDLKASLLSLQGLELIYEKQLFPELEYVFKHALTQEVAYNGLLLKRRREIHEKIGQSIEQIYAERLEEYCELLAYHYVRSDNTVKAVAYLDLANQKAAKASAMEEAKAYFDKAMELLDTLPETEENLERRISLLVNQHLVFAFLLRLPEYYELIVRHEPLVAKLKNQRIRGAFCLRSGGCEWVFGDLDKAVETLTKGARLCEAAGDTEEVGLGYYVLGYVHLARGDYQRVLELKEDVLRMGENGFHLRRYVRACCTASEACSELGRWDEAVELGQKALSKAQDFSDNALVSWSAWTLSYAFTHKRDLDRAMEYGELAAARAPTPGEKAYAQTYLAWTWCHRGEPRRGLEVLEGLLTIYRSVRYAVRQLLTLLFLGEGYLLVGQLDKVKETAEDLLTLAERSGTRGYIGQAHRLLGETFLRTSPNEAGAHFEKCIDLFREIQAENALAHAYAGIGRLHKQQGNTEQTHEYLTKALDIFERLGTLIEPDKVRKELAQLPQ